MSNQKPWDDSLLPPYFQWILDGKLAAFAFPSKRPHIKYLMENNIKTLISLQNYPDPPLADFKEMNWHKINVKEFHPPTVPQMVRFVEIVDKALDSGHVSTVHTAFVDYGTATDGRAWGWFSSLCLAPVRLVCEHDRTLHRYVQYIHLIAGHPMPVQREITGH